MPDRINQRWPDGLYDRAKARAGARGVTAFTVRAVEQALGESGENPATSPSAPAEPPEEPYVPEWKKRSLGSRPSGPVPKESGR